MRSTGRSPNIDFSVAGRSRHTYPVQGFTRAVIVCPSLKQLMGLQAIYKGPNTSKKHPQHRIYPYLLRKLPITQANHVCCIDITYIPVQRGFLYLVAIMDWATRKVLSCQFLCGGFERSHRQIRQTRNHEYRSGFSVHWFGMDNHSH